MPKQFFYVCAGMLCLAVAYHLGAQNATAQSGGVVAGFTAQPGAPGESAGAFYVITANGDIFGRYMAPGGGANALAYYGNFWSGAPTPAVQQSFGQLKVRYR